MEQLTRLAEKECSPECNGKWFQCATQVLQWNSINKFVFSAAIRGTFRKGQKENLKTAEVAYLNDFRWSKELIAWQERLNLLAPYAPYNLSRLKNVFVTDFLIPIDSTLLCHWNTTNRICWFIWSEG